MSSSGPVTYWHRHAARCCAVGAVGAAAAVPGQERPGQDGAASVGAGQVLPRRLVSVPHEMVQL